MDFAVNKNNENTLEATNTSDLIAELKRRNDFDEVFKMATDNKILGKVRNRELDKFVIKKTNDETIEHLMKTR